MQTGNTASSLYSQALHHIHHQQQAQASAADYDLKRRYLTLLPPQQIIEICLTFDFHVPLYVKSTVWPPDFNAAIAAIQAAMPPPASNTGSSQPPKTEVPVMDSLMEPPNERESATPAPDQPPSTASEPKPPEPSTSSPAPVTPQPAEPPKDTAPQPPAAPAYPTQPHAFANQPAYPHHTPYYGPPAHTWPPYSHVPYPTPPSSYPPQSGMAPLPTYRNAASPDPPQSSDDMPSYEEMIVEALTECSDPQGMLAPKDLYNWMSSRYPVQSNFRPSASQALQKAYRRGRFEKSSSGKYRLNPKWDGSTTTRRTTRRPQTHNTASTPTQPSQPMTSPFTHAPLTHNHHQPTGQPPGAGPYSGYPYTGYSGYSQPPPPAAETSQTNGTRPTSTAEETGGTGELNDVYEAAQHILKTINFGSLLQLPSNENDTTADGPAADGSAGENPANTGMPVEHSDNQLVDDPSVGAGIMTGGDAGALDGVDESQRAELQAQLALLSVQLTDLAQEMQAEAEAAVASAIAVAPVLANGIASPAVQVAEQEEEDDEDDDEDMDEVIV